MQVEATHLPKRKFKVKDIKPGGRNAGAAGTFFMNEQAGREMSVAEYFKEQYKIRCGACSETHDLLFTPSDPASLLSVTFIRCSLRYPHYPLLNVGSPAKAVYLPIELCKLARGQRQLSLDSRQTADMIKITAQQPAERKRRILRALNEDSRLPTDAVARAFGIEVSGDMEMVRLPLS